MVSECYLVAAESLCVLIEITASHAGAEVAGVVVDLRNGIEYLCFKHLNRYFEKRGIVDDLLSVYLVVAGIHYKEDCLERYIAAAL